MLTDFLKELFLNSLKMIEQPWNGKMPFVVKFQTKSLFYMQHFIAMVNLRLNCADMFNISISYNPDDANLPSLAILTASPFNNVSKGNK